MATYKVLQDIEAEDKLFGPFTLKQFIFAAVAIGIGFLGVRILIAGLPIFVTAPIILALLPFFLVFGFLAAPIGQDQPNDVWLFARLRFLFKPRVRIWNQDGISELVTVTAPKKVETVFTKDFTQDEVHSRLRALANTVDSRGWAVKNVNTNLFSSTGYLEGNQSDRLLDPGSLPQEVSNIEVLPSDDMLDPRTSATAQHLDQLIKQSSAQHKQQVISQMSNPTPAAPQAPTQDYWFMNQPAAPQTPLPQDYATFASQQVVAPGAQDVAQAAEATEEEKMLIQKITAEQKQADTHANDHMKVLQPLHDREGNLVNPGPQPATVAADAETASQPAPPNTVQTDANKRQDPINPAILGLANNDDLDVATIARQAQKINGPNDDGEVVISLH